MSDKVPTKQKHTHDFSSDKASSLVAALEYMIDGFQAPAEYRPQLFALKQQLSALSDHSVPASIIQGIADIAVAAQRQFLELQGQNELRISQLEAEVEEMTRSLQNADQQSQASYQAAQKVGNTLERQIEDMESRIRRGGGNDNSLKSAVQQSISIVKARLEDYQEQGGQQFSQMSSQMQALSGKLTEIGSWAGEFRQALQVSQLQLQEDALTGVAGRVTFESELAQRLADENGVVLILWDVDKFRDINQHYGREAGDRTLQLVSGILQRRLRENDFIARYGRDRFVVILNESSSDAARDVAERLQAAIAEAEFHSHGRPVSLSVCGGIAAAREGDAVAELLNRATEALLGAKQQGINSLDAAD
ncbi:MAG: diguanylate cyclase [Proteobacteria bacterium]|nr:diguanylate cyclase [Pseudomonadota bacterium]